MKIKWLAYWCFALLFFSCQDEGHLTPTGAYSEGVFIINEGIFGQTSGTISHYNPNTSAVEQKIFNKVNQRDLGDVVQSLSIHEGKAYIVVNNSNKIEVVDQATFKEVAQITGLRLPRYLLPISTTQAYVTEWGANGLVGTIAVLDLSTNTVVNRISVGGGPERLYEKDGKIYVTHTGGYATNNIVSVLNPTTHQLETTITVLDKPSTCVEDKDGHLWVACGGKIVYTTYPTIDTVNSTVSGLVKINPATNTVVSTLSFGKGKPIGNLMLDAITKDELYYTKVGKVWKYNIANATETALFDGRFYGMDLQPSTNYIYGATNSGINAAYAKRYTNAGVLVDSFPVGVFANGFVFSGN